MDPLTLPVTEQEWEEEEKSRYWLKNKPGHVGCLGLVSNTLDSRIAPYKRLPAYSKKQMICFQKPGFPNDSAPEKSSPLFFPSVIYRPQLAYQPTWFIQRRVNWQRKPSSLVLSFLNVNELIQEVIEEVLQVDYDTSAEPHLMQLLKYLQRIFNKMLLW